MTTIPLYSTGGHPDASHHITSPGGYEWWYFDAEDVQHERQFVAVLYDGCPFRPDYVRAYARYRRRPTRVPPPLPREHPCLYFALFEKGRIVHEHFTEYPADALVARHDRPEVALAQNSFSTEGSKLKLDLRHVATTGAGQVQAEFRFEPRLACAPQERQLFPARAHDRSPEHIWIIANPLCDVTGTIRCADRAIEFRGLGYHDHHFGTATPATALRSWFRGRVLFDDAAYAFHIVVPHDRALPNRARLVEVRASSGVVDVAVQRVEATWSGLTRRLLRYPLALRFENELLHLSSPRLMRTSCVRAHLTCAAQVGRRNGRALCELIYPRRLMWPIVRRSLLPRRGEGSIMR
jgi:hypothetical protein